MELIKMNPNNEQFYSEDFIKGFNCGAERQLAKDMVDILEMDQANQRKGKWKETGRMTQHGRYYYFRYCTKCFYARDDCDSEKDTNFCPNCGADMRGEE